MAGGGPLCAELDMSRSRVRDEVIGVAHQPCEVCDREGVIVVGERVRLSGRERVGGPG